MSNDRELLELAAKAAGYDETRTCIDEWFWVNTSGDEWEPWNPLTDDGDALRLAVRLGILLATREGRPIGETEPDYHSDPYAATRRAITRAAAEIGGNMK